MLETVFFLVQCAIKIKRIAESVIENEVRCRIQRSEVKSCKAEIRKAKTKVACRDNTQSCNQTETMSSKGKRVYDREWDRNSAYKQY